MRLPFNIFVIVRVLIGGVFVAASWEKVISPYQNFLYVVESYAFLPPVLEVLVARILPWIELVLGAFLIMGLWTKRVLRFFAVLIVGFISVVTQALVRGLPIDECGCFGDMMAVPLWGILLFDTILLIFTILLLIRLDLTRRCSLDSYFERGTI